MRTLFRIQGDEPARASRLLAIILIAMSYACVNNNGGEFDKQSKEALSSLKEFREDKYTRMDFYSVSINLPDDISNGKVWEFSLRLLLDRAYKNQVVLMTEDPSSVIFDYKWKIDSICKALPLLKLKRYDILVIKEISTVSADNKPHRVDLFGNGIYIDNIFAPIITTYTSLIHNDDREFYNWDRRGIYYTAVAEGGINNGVKCTGYRIELSHNNTATLKYYVSNGLYGKEREKRKNKLLD